MFGWYFTIAVVFAGGKYFGISDLYILTLFVVMCLIAVWQNEVNFSARMDSSDRKLDQLTDQVASLQARISSLSSTASPQPHWASEEDPPFDEEVEEPALSIKDLEAKMEADLREIEQMKPKRRRRASRK